MTNNERINQMSIEEKATAMSNVCKYCCAGGNKNGLCDEQYSSCYLGIKKWLESECENNG